MLGTVIYGMRFLWRMYLFSASFQLAELLRQRVFRQLTTMAPAFYHKHRTGDLVAHQVQTLGIVGATGAAGTYHIDSVPSPVGGGGR